MIAFRLDANAHVATGHMYRCMAIAKECRKKGYECVFFLADDVCADILDKAGFDYCVLNLKWDDWNYGIDLVKKAVWERKVDCLVVDSYRVTEQFFTELHQEVPIFYLDDICKQKYDLNAVLHYSEWSDERILQAVYEGTDVSVYTGMEYMPLREGFCQTEANSDKKYDFLITTGGSDTFHVTLKVLKSMLAECEFGDATVCAVLGKMNTDAEEIYELCESHDNVTILQNISNMDEIMSRSKFAVTAGGTTVYELMASGIPFVCFGFSQDQCYFGERLEAHGNAKYAGDAREDADLVVKNIIAGLKQFYFMNKDEAEEQIRVNCNLIDGRGAERVADIIIDLCEEKDR